MNDYREIPLSHGNVAIVDACDYERLTKWKWHSVWNEVTQSWYALRRIGLVNGKHRSIYMQRAVMGLEHGDGIVVDHIENGNTLDNRRSNLRICSKSQNAMNSRRHKDNKSGFKGVSWGKKDRKWVAQVCLQGQRVYRKGFHQKEDAAQVYALMAFLHFGEFSRIEKVALVGKGID